MARLIGSTKLTLTSPWTTRYLPVELGPVIFMLHRTRRRNRVCGPLRSPKKMRPPPTGLSKTRHAWSVAREPGGEVVFHLFFEGSMAQRPPLTLSNFDRRAISDSMITDATLVRSESKFTPGRGCGARPVIHTYCRCVYRRSLNPEYQNRILGQHLRKGIL